MSTIGMTLRSSKSVEDKNIEKERIAREKEERENRPFIEYKGKIIYHTDFISCAMVFDDLLKEADNADDLFILGFDLEWPFNFIDGPGRTAVIQISPNLQIAYVLQVSKLTKLPKGLNELLAHSKVRLTGLNIKNDIRKLSRDFKITSVDTILNNCIDCGVLANSVLPFTQRWSLAKLVDYVLKLKINKDKKVRMSRWNVVPLSEPQQRYAAIDTYASLLVYLRLKEIEKIHPEDANSLIQFVSDQ